MDTPTTHFMYIKFEEHGRRNDEKIMTTRGPGNKENHCMVVSLEMTGKLNTYLNDRSL